MEEAQEIFETEFDPLPPPVLPDVGYAERAIEQTHLATREACTACPTLSVVDLDDERADWPDAAARTQAFTLWLRSADFDSHRRRAADLVRQLLADNPFTTLQIILEPLGDPTELTVRTLEILREACYFQPTYLDKFYSVLPGRPKGAKRLVVLLSNDQRCGLDAGWLDQIDQYATLVFDDGLGNRQLVAAASSRRN